VTPARCVCGRITAFPSVFFTYVMSGIPAGLQLNFWRLNSTQLYLKILFVPRRKHPPSMLYKTRNVRTRWFKYDRDKLWLVYTQISPGHIWTTLYNVTTRRVIGTLRVCVCMLLRGCVHVALLIQYATRMRHILTSFVAPLSPLYFSTLSHKRYDFRGKSHWT
jgi:hypothetical protein